MKGKLGARLRSPWCTAASLRKNFTYGNGEPNMMANATRSFFFNYTLSAILKRWSAVTSTWIYTHFNTFLSGSWQIKPLKIRLEGEWVPVTTDTSVRPTLTILAPVQYGPNPFIVTIVSDTPLATLELADILCYYGTMANLTKVHDFLYTVEVTHSTTTSVVLQILADVVHGKYAAPVDNNYESAIVQVLYDGVQPVANISARSAINNDPFNITITFTKPVVDFIESKVLVTGGTTSNFINTSGTYTVTITPDGSGDIVIDLDGANIHDASGNSPQVTPVTVIYDNTPLVITSVQAWTGDRRAPVPAQNDIVITFNKVVPNFTTILGTMPTGVGGKINMLPVIGSLSSSDNKTFYIRSNFQYSISPASASWTITPGYFKDAAGNTHADVAPLEYTFTYGTDVTAELTGPASFSSITSLRIYLTFNTCMANWANGTAIPKTSITVNNCTVTSAGPYLQRNPYMDRDTLSVNKTDNDIFYFDVTPSSLADISIQCPAGVRLAYYYSGSDATRPPNLISNLLTIPYIP